MQSKLPILLSIAFVTSIAVLGTRQLRDEHGAPLAVGAVLLGLYVLWLATEARVAASEIGRDRTELDRGTLELYAGARAATVLGALVMHVDAEGFVVRAPIGLGLFLAGVALRLTAIATLGRFYSHRVRIAGAHELVETGPYRVVRHPAYAGMLLAHIGFVLIFWNVVAVGLLVAVFLPAVLLRIRVEERALVAISGYEVYRRAHKRLIPGVW